MKINLLMASLVSSILLVGCSGGGDSSNTETTYDLKDYMFPSEVNDGTKVYKKRMIVGGEVDDTTYQAYKKDSDKINLYGSNDQFFDDSDLINEVYIRSNEIFLDNTVDSNNDNTLKRFYKINDTFTTYNNVTCTVTNHFDSVDVISKLNEKLPSNMKISNVSKVYNDVAEVKCTGIDSNNNTVNEVRYLAKDKYTVGNYKNEINSENNTNNTHYSYLDDEEFTDEL